jgi:hemolysin activation/secretion protein
MKKILFMILFFLMGVASLCFSQASSMGKIQKSQTDIEMEKSLRVEAEKAKKVLIKKIVVKGATLITEDQVKAIILPLKNHWLSKADINYILDSIVCAYKQNGRQIQPARISYKIKKNYLEINVQEIRHWKRT